MENTKKYSVVKDVKFFQIQTSAEVLAFAAQENTT